MLSVLGLPRWPTVTLTPVWGKRYSGRKLPECTLEINIDIMRRIATVDRGPDTTFRSWVHESLHGRLPYADHHKKEYDVWCGYEEGLVEALARLVVREHAGLNPIEPPEHDYFVTAYQTLSEAMDVGYESLLRALWTSPTGLVRNGLEDVIDSLRQVRSLPPLTHTQRITLAMTADRSFATANLGRTPNKTIMVTLWRGRSR
jgi:hypothetical protein